MMIRITCFILFLFAVSTVLSAPKDDKKSKDSGDVKELLGISIVGNKEAPKALYIVPWKDSQVGVETSLTHGFLDENLKPVDREVFMRELDFYQFSHGAK